MTVRGEPKATVNKRSIHKENKMSKIPRKPNPISLPCDFNDSKEERLLTVIFGAYNPVDTEEACNVAVANCDKVEAAAQTWIDDHFDDDLNILPEFAAQAKEYNDLLDNIEEEKHAVSLLGSIYYRRAAMCKAIQKPKCRTGKKAKGGKGQ